MSLQNNSGLGVSLGDGAVASKTSCSLSFHTASERFGMRALATEM